MAISAKEVQKRTMIKKTIAEMARQIQRLENQKSGYVTAAKEAKENGLTEAYNFAINALKITIVQQRRVTAMKLNFEVASQMKDMAKMTADFLQGMSVISKDMASLTKSKDFRKIEKDFSKAMSNTCETEDRIDSLLTEIGSAYETMIPETENLSSEMDALMIDSPTVANQPNSMNLEESIERELESLKEKIG